MVKGVSALLWGFRMLKHVVSKGSRTAHNTATNANKECYGEWYVHFGLDKNIQRVLEDPTACNFNEVHLQIIIDGLTQFSFLQLGQTHPSP